VTDRPHLPEEAEAVPDAAERAELERLADELRAACRDPELAPDFRERLALRLRRAPMWRRTLRRSVTARLAASVLVLLLAAGPIAAVALFWPELVAPRVLLGFEPTPPPPAPARPADAPPPPVVPPPDERFGPEWETALLRANRMARAARSWRQAGAAAPLPGHAVVVADWDLADAEALWNEFVRRCATGQTDAPEPELVARVRALAAEADPEAMEALAPWLWVLDGQPTTVGPGRAWPGAPWPAD